MPKAIKHPVLRSEQMGVCSVLHLSGWNPICMVWSGHLNQVGLFLLPNRETLKGFQLGDVNPPASSAQTIWGALALSPCPDCFVDRQRVIPWGRWMRRHSQSSSWSLVPLFCQNYSRSWMLRITKWMQESISSPVGCWQSHPPMLAWLFIANSKRCYLCPKCNHFVVHGGDGEMQGAHFAGGFIALVRVLAKPLATPLVFRCWADLVAYSQCSHALETNTVYWAVRWHY